MTSDLIIPYFYHRQRGITASLAYRYARADMAANKPRHRTLGRDAMRGGADFKIGSERVFWCECPNDYLRRVGFADDVWREQNNRMPRDIHSGWFLEDDGSNEKARGVVFQLPARKGETRFLYGVADPFNDGPAILSLDVVSDVTDAARWADQLAERYAEDERDRNRAWRAGQRFAELGDDIAEHRRDCLALIREIKAQGKTFGAAICEVLRDHVESHLRDIRKARDTRAELESSYGHVDAFNEGKAI